jgi:ATP-binding cassette subfamily C protein CydC
MRALLPYLALYKRHFWLLLLGVILAIVTLLASIGLLTLSGWFLSASAVVGAAGLYSFNYMLPAAGFAVPRLPVPPGAILSGWSATTRPSACCNICASPHSANCCRSPAGLSRFRQGELLNRVVADVDTLDHLYLRVISPLVGALVVIAVVTVGLSVLDVSLALMLGGIMLATLIILPPLFYRAGKPTGESLTQLRGQYRQQLTTWLQGQAELTIFGASQRYREQMENTELSWHDAQRRQSDLTAASQAVMLLIGALAVLTMLWFASGSVGDNTQPGALIALFVFCALAAFEALAPVTGAFQHLGQVIASAVRITQITDCPPEVQFPSPQ